jgi:FixJ family two-component response regulator
MPYSEHTPQNTPAQTPEPTPIVETNAEPTQPLVLFLDDESKVLDSLRRNIYKTKFSGLFTTKPQEALAWIQEKNPAIVITDMRMPEMSGVQFLQLAQAITTEPVYIVLSGYSDIELIMQSINEYHIWRYILKPWQREELLLNLENAFEMYTMRKERRLLLTELEEKNKLLLSWNEQLEQKVEIRTRQLARRSQLLTMVLEDNPLAEIIKDCCAFMNESTQGEYSFYIPFLNAWYTEQGICPTPPLVLQQSSIKASPWQQDGFYCIPVLKRNTALGLLAVKTPPPTQLTEQMHKDLLAIIALYLEQLKNVQDPSALNQNIDRFLNEL